MAKNARKKVNQLSQPEAIKEMIEWVGKGETANPRYKKLRKIYPTLDLDAYRKTKPNPAPPKEEAKEEPKEAEVTEKTEAPADAPVETV